MTALGDTRATGSSGFEGTGLRITTTGSTNTDEVAEYVATDVSLADADEPELDYANTSGGGVPGFQSVVDFDGSGGRDGILVGEAVYDGDWWLSNSAAPFVKDGAPVTGGGSGSAWHGTLDEWRAEFPDAEVLAFGFSLGSGVEGDGVIEAIEFADTRFTFARHVSSPPSSGARTAAGRPAPSRCSATRVSASPRWPGPADAGSHSSAEARHP